MTLRAAPLAAWRTSVALLLLAACGSAEPADVEGSVVVVSLTSCEPGVENRATAVVIGDGLALTVAHSFDDAASATLRGPDGQLLAGELVYLDRARDLALLSFDSPQPWGTLDVHTDAEDPTLEARMVVVRDGATELLPVELLQRTEVTFDGEGPRQAIELGTSIDQGDSGAPVIDENGRIIGLVFASNRTADTGWAIAGSELIDISSLAGATIPLTCPTGAGG